MRGACARIALDGALHGAVVTDQPGESWRSSETGGSVEREAEVSFPTLTLNSRELTL